jgi:hypothetical protein
MEDDPMRLRVTADTCRRLLGSINDPETLARLTALAQECEAKLSTLAERWNDESQPPD